MKPFAIELNDRALSIAREGRVLSSAQSAIFDGNSAEPAGRNAWAELRRQPTSISTRHLDIVIAKGERSNE